ncbi:hypothetical protein [uncultured Cytophaga sp.]|uniref:hypothetical protein n=1 Tax=uncultured Cytophaga sp. TaxID=160238 RepID=UPI0026351B51|nr:hypothetical protein [uncultured Cytophaga sp.]
MSRVKSKSLFDLIHSLSPNEKRHFKLNHTSSGDLEDKKMLLLFDYLNKQKVFNEERISEVIPSIKASQLSNLKAYLYEKILFSLRQYNLPKILDLQIREQIDFAQLLFERRLYQQGKTCLKKARRLSQVHENLELTLEIIKLEKSILMLTIDEDIEQTVDAIIEDVQKINAQIHNVNMFSNLNIKLNSYYTRIGFIRDEEDSVRVKEYFISHLPDYKEEDLSVGEKITLYLLYIGYYYFLQDFSNGHLYANQLVHLYEENPDRIKFSPENYVKALNNLMIAEFKLNYFNAFVESKHKLINFTNDSTVYFNERLKTSLLKYYFIHELNLFFLTGEFHEGVKKLFVERKEDIDELLKKLDTHSALILMYKIACLYFGAGLYNHCLRWLNKIINIPNVDIREDIHCFARIINLICHYELGNFDVIKYYIISTYRFLWKRDDLRMFQKFILKFLKDLNDDVDVTELVGRFSTLKNQLVPIENSAYEKRAFIYFDIIAWLESKIEGSSVQIVIMNKAKARGFFLSAEE